MVPDDATASADPGVLLRAYWDADRILFTLQFLGIRPALEDESYTDAALERSGGVELAEESPDAALNEIVREHAPLKSSADIAALREAVLSRREAISDELAAVPAGAERAKQSLAAWLASLGHDVDFSVDTLDAALAVPGEVPDAIVRTLSGSWRAGARKLAQEEIVIDELAWMRATEPYEVIAHWRYAERFAVTGLDAAWDVVRREAAHWLVEPAPTPPQHRGWWHYPSNCRLTSPTPSPLPSRRS